MSNGESKDRYVPAAGFSLLTRFYDPIVTATMREENWRPEMIAEIGRGIPEGGTAVDVGAGTGTFAIALKQARPDLEVIGIDGDPEALAIARRKPGAELVVWREGLAQELPLASGLADAVSTSLMLHHLAPDAKVEALVESRRILKPGGTLHVADWGRPRDPVIGAAFFGLRVLDGFSNTRDHAEGRIPELIRAAGFESAEVWDRLRTPFGSLELIRAERE